MPESVAERAMQPSEFAERGLPVFESATALKWRYLLKDGMAREAQFVRKRIDFCRLDLNLRSVIGGVALKFVSYNILRLVGMLHS
ncbi:unnamed protein product [Toxocara canis]|uniref:Tnp_DDE_dom domain-containing protein n=1 Tax=Toxocara canis TaxID=6265 RepID=A0A183VAV4_TOXCA|nr:unnamed protein product [Toxocara canis]